MTTYAQPECFRRKCKHFVGITKGQYVCTAFPNRIPDDIAFGPSLHIVKRRGDGGITFEKDKTGKLSLTIVK